jgi:hypothetical protein
VALNQEIGSHRRMKTFAVAILFLLVAVAFASTSASVALHNAEVDRASFTTRPIFAASTPRNDNP